MAEQLNRREFLAGAAGVALAAPGAWAGERGLLLAEGGRSPYAIVRPEQATPSQLYAAEELQRFTREMTGATLPIVTDAAPLPAHAILLGKTRFTPLVAGEADMARLGTDGFLLRTRSPHLAILGSGVRGTLYGVYELLERHGGCRWYASFHSVIPRRRSWRLPPLDETQVPGFAVREPWWRDLFEGDFAARCRVNGHRMMLEERHGGHVRFGGGLFCHTFYRLLPPEEYFDRHPEYFSEVRGRRVGANAQLCLTNDDVLRIVTENVLSRIRRDPTAKMFSVSQNDWGGYCTCARCRAVDEEEGSHAGALLRFVNRVAEAVEKEFPDVWIETLAYQWGRTPPRHVTPRRNVVVRLSTIACDFSRPLPVSRYPQNQSFLSDIKGWTAMTDKLFVWDYVTNFHNYIGPHPNFAALQPNVQFFRDSHAVGLLEQGAYEARHAEFAELKAWILSKLLWNPDQPMAPLLEDFFHGYYGPAAGPVRTYFEELQALVKDPKFTLRIFDSINAPWLTGAFLKRAAVLWDEAERRVKEDPKALYRVRMSGIPVYYARFQRMPDPPRHYELEGEWMQPAGGSPEYQQVSRELLRRIEEGKVWIREWPEYNAAAMAHLEAQARGSKVVALAGGGVSAAAAPGVGGGVVKLAAGAGPNLLAAGAGGLEVVDRHWLLGSPDLDAFEVTKSSRDTVLMQRTVKGQGSVDRSVQAAGGRLEFTHAWRLDAGQAVDPCVRIALKMRADAVRIRAGGWDEVLQVPEGQTHASYPLPAVACAAGEWLVAPAAGGPAVRVAWPGAAWERGIVSLDARAGVVLLLALLPRWSAGKDGVLSLPVAVSPAGEEPAREMILPERHRADRVVVQEWETNLRGPGKWAEIAFDLEASDGYAICMFNTNVEWNALWDIEPGRFEPGVRYRARARLRVAKSGRAGEALWAGIWDTNRREGIAQIAPTTAEVKDGYQWYDLGAWVPAAGHYLYVGPGRYDRRSAIEGLRLDRYELVRE